MLKALPFLQLFHMKNYIAFLMILVHCSFLYAQNQASTWYFGEEAGLHFGKNAITTLNDGNIKYKEGIACISDCLGRLLFYTDAVTVWNSSHAVMANGSGLNGHYSATQGALIVPQPGDCNLYYIFTVDGKEKSFANGLQFHVVDMNLQNGSGEIISKNNLLYSLSSEKLTAVRHKNERDYWIVTHLMYSDQFYAYLLTDAGINSSPVISTAGLPFSNTFDGLGQMKISPGGSRLALVTLVTKRAEVFDFDDATGIVSNPVTIPSTSFTNDGGLYGVEFSPDGSKLYITNHTLDYVNKSGSLYQIDLLAGNAAGIINSGTVVGSNASSTDLRGLQLGPGGKLYAARSLGKFLGVVQDPDAKGTACNYTDLGLSLNGQVCNWTLPNFVTSFFREDQPGELQAKFNTGPACINKETFFMDESEGDPDEFLWYFGDSTTSTLQHPSHTYNSTGIYEITLIIRKECCTDTVRNFITVEDCFYTAYLPNAFTPNGDGFNDVFQVKGGGIQSMELVIYNRWGTKLFFSQRPEEGWDGSISGAEAPAGVYAYTLNAGFKNGEQKKINGYVVLFR